MLEERFELLSREGTHTSRSLRARLESALLWIFFEQLDT